MTGRRPDVLTFGESVVALRLGSGTPEPSVSVSVSGAESSVAIGLARRGHAVRWAGAVGADEAGELVLRTLRAEGVDVSGAHVDDGGAPTGLVLAESGRSPGGSAGSRLEACSVERAFTAAPPRILHLTGITPALSRSARSAAALALRLAAEHSALVCLDVNFRSRLWDAREAAAVLREWAPSVDVLIASEEELPLCLPVGGPGDVEVRVKELLAVGIGEVVVRAGPGGAVAAVAYGDDGSAVRVPVPVPVPVPVGSAYSDADGFVAGYLSGFLDGLDAAGRLARAVAAGADPARLPTGPLPH